MIYLKENRKPMDAVIFDLGNVLLDYSPRRILGEIGISPDLHDRIAAVLFEDLETWTELDRGTITSADLIDIAVSKEPFLRKEITEFIREWPYHFNAIPENVAALYRIIETGTKIYVLSNFALDVFRIEQKRNVFLSEFDGFIISSEHHLVKPDPAIYRLLIETFDLDPDRSVFIDDIEANINAAIAAGLNGIHLPARTDVSSYFIFPESE